MDMIYREDGDWFSDEIASMCKMNSHTDVKILVKEEDTEEVFKAHKYLLSVGSPVFAEKFKETSPSNADSVTLSNVSIRGFKCLLWFMYNDQLKVESVKDLVEVAKAARRLKVEGVVKTCKYELDHYKIREYNVLSMLEASKYFKMDILLAQCIEFLESADLSDILRTPGLLEISRETIFLIFNEGLFSSESEAHLMEAAIRWLKHNNCRDRDLLSKIHTMALNCDEFLDIIEKFPSYFTSKEVASILTNLLRSGHTALPPWCETLEDKRETVLSAPYDLIAAKSLQLKTDCSRPFLNSRFYGEDGFEGSIIMELKLTKDCQTHPYLVMLELAFGSSYVPQRNLTLDLFLFEQGSLLRKKRIGFRVQATVDHYYLIVHRMRLIPKHPFVFSLTLKVSGQKDWEDDSPVSDGQYRAALIPEDIFNTVRCVNTRSGFSACLTALSDWMVFLDPVLGEKKHIVTSFYFDPLLAKFT